MSGIKVSSTSPEPSTSQFRATDSKTIPAAKSAPVPGRQTVSAIALFLETAAALGFPKDSLSAALLTFARFFSLSPALLGSLRREFLNANKNAPSLLNQGNEASNGKQKMTFEAGAFATAAALDKGVALSPEAHAHYTRYLVPPEPLVGQKTGNDASPGSGGGKNKDDDKDNEAPAPEKIKAIAEEESGKDDLLDFLNSLPGKNGQHWVVFPFNIQVRGIELTVFVRILKREPLLSAESAFLIADISGPKRQWRCFLRADSGKILADLRVYPSVSERTLNRLRKEAESFLCADPGSALDFGGFAGILVGNREESPSWMDDLCAESLLSIDREV